MKKVVNRWFLFTSISLLMLLLSACGSNKTDKVVANDNNEEPTVETRLVTTTATLTNIFAELNLDLVGMSETSYDIPERYEGLPTVGNAMDPDEEKIISLKPTEVFSVTTLQNDLEKGFDSFGIKSRFINLQGIDNMFEAISEIGSDYDRTKEAEKLVGTIQREIDELAATVADKKSPTVLILLGIPGSYLVASENSYIGDLVKKAGGTNVAQGEDQPEYLSSNTEYLHQSNPDIILRLAHGWPEKVVEMFNEEFKTNDIWKHFNAVKNDRVYDLEEPLFGTTANLQAPEALRQLIEIMYEN